jgi:hypothetical protein
MKAGDLFPVTTTYGRTLPTVSWEQYTKSQQFVFLLQQRTVVPCSQSVKISTQSHNNFGYIPYYIISYFEIKLCKHISTLPYMNHHIYFLRFIILKCFLKATIHRGLAHNFTLLFFYNSLKSTYRFPVLCSTDV